MKLKKRYIYSTALISVVSILALVVLQFRLYAIAYDYFQRIIGNSQLMVNLKAFGITIFGGVFTGAILTLSLSIVDYFYERKKALEEVYYASETLQKSLNKIKFFLPDEPWEIIREYLIEIEINKSAERFNREIDEKVAHVLNKTELEEKFLGLKSQKSYEAERKINEYLWGKLTDAERQCYDKTTYLQEKRTEKIEQYKKQIETVLKSYLLINTLSTNALSMAYGELDFMFSNKSKRKRIHQNLYQKQYDVICFIKIRAVYVEEYFEINRRNIAVMLGIIEGVQKMLLAEDEKFYYKQHCYEMDSEMTQILAYANGKKNKGEFPKRNLYIAKVKPEAIAHLLKEDEKDK